MPKELQRTLKLVTEHSGTPIVEEAIKMGFTGIGVANGFVHVDIRNLDGNEAPVMWCY